MKTKITFLVVIGCALSIIATLNRDEQSYHTEFGGFKPGSFGLLEANAYPPAVGILSNSKNCVSCHTNNGPWNDDKTIIDVVDKATGKSLKDADGNFQVTVSRNEILTLLTVIGRSKNDSKPYPYRNAWIYVDPATIGSTSLSKFAPGWETNLQLSCRVVGDKSPSYEGAAVTILPMTIRPTDAARNTELQLQVMLTSGESVN
jgi:hypothetical protein